MNNNDITITIRANPDQLRAAMATAVKSTKDLSRSGGNNFSSFLSSAKTSLKGVEGAITSMLKVGGGIALSGSFGLVKATKAAWDQVNAVQQAEVELKRYYGAGKQTNSVLKDLIKYAQSDMGVLFNRKDLFAAAGNLAMYGVEASKVNGYVKIQSRLASTNKVSWEDLNNVIGRVISSGKLSRTEWEMLNKAGAGLDDSLANTSMTAEELFKVLDNPATRNLEQDMDNITPVGIRFDSALRGVGNAFLGVNDVGNKFVKGGLGDMIIKTLQGMTDYFKSPAMKDGISNLGKQMTEFMKAAEPVIKNVLQWMIDNFDTVIKGVLGLVGALVAVKVAVGIITAVEAAIKMWTAAQWLLNAAMNANPLGLIVIAIVAVIAAIVLLWQNSETFRNIVTGVFNAVWGAIKAVFGWIKKNWPLLLAILTGPIGIAIALIIRHWDTIKKAFAAALKFIKGVWGGIAGWFGGLWSGITNAFKSVKTWFGNMFKGAVSVVKSAFNALPNFFKGVWTKIRNTVTSLAGKIGSAAGNAVRGAVNGAISTVQNVINGFIGTINGAIGLINKIPKVNIPRIPRVSLPRMATGGIVDAVSGGRDITVAEGGQSEWIVPESKMASAAMQLARMAGIDRAKPDSESTGIVIQNGASFITVQVDNHGKDNFTDSDAIDIGKKIARALKAQGLNINQLSTLRG